MISASALRLQIESTLSRKVPSALTPAPKLMRPVAATGIEALDDVLLGGLPIGAISEMVGPECSGRTSVALSFLAQMTQAGKVCCWIDVANTFDPASAAAIGVDLTRLLWVRCGVAQTRVQRDAHNFVLPEKYLIPSPHKKGLHGGGFGPHPRSEVNGLSEAVTGLLRPEAIAPRCAEPQRRVRQKREAFQAHLSMWCHKGTKQSEKGFYFSFGKWERTNCRQHVASDGPFAMEGRSQTRLKTGGHVRASIDRSALNRSW
jgi:hypothetical protein